MKIQLTTSIFCITFVSVFFGIMVSCAQDQPQYKNIVIKIQGETSDFFEPEQLLSGVQLDIIQDDKTIYSQKSTEGKYTIEHRMDISKAFYVKFSKPSYLSKMILIDFNEDSLKKVLNWSDTIVPFTNLDMILPFAEPIFNKIKVPVLVAEFTLENQKPALNGSKAKETKKMLDKVRKLYSGEAKYYYPNGNPKAFLNIKNGELEGECSWWDENGNNYKKANYVLGVAQE